MSEETVVRQAAPTLAGVKTGSLFPYRCQSAEELRADIRAFNRMLVPRGMCLLVLKMMERSALLYLYRPAKLERDLRDSTAREVLEEAGYSCESCAACVRELVQRFHREGEFPHEIGLFLSYPPEDATRPCACGRSTATRSRPAHSAPDFRNAPSVTAASGRRAAAWSSWPWRADGMRNPI